MLLIFSSSYSSFFDVASLASIFFLFSQEDWRVEKKEITSVCSLLLLLLLLFSYSSLLKQTLLGNKWDILYSFPRLSSFPSPSPPPLSSHLKSMVAIARVDVNRQSDTNRRKSLIPSLTFLPVQRTKCTWHSWMMRFVWHKTWDRNTCSLLKKKRDPGADTDTLQCVLQSCFKEKGTLILKKEDLTSLWETSYLQRHLLFCMNVFSCIFGSSHKRCRLDPWPCIAFPSHVCVQRTSLARQTGRRWGIPALLSCHDPMFLGVAMKTNAPV